MEDIRFLHTLSELCVRSWKHASCACRAASSENGLCPVLASMRGQTDPLTQQFSLAGLPELKQSEACFHLKSYLQTKGLTPEKEVDDEQAHYF